MSQAINAGPATAAGLPFAAFGYHPYPLFEIARGDALEVLRTLPSQSVNCCITSPPYWGLRDYGTARWEGGDPQCDHRNLHGVQGADGERAERSFTGAQNWYREKCRKCGAIRVDQQIGLERTPDEYVSRLVRVFGEVRRVLRNDGTLWLNLGDCYATGAGRVGNCPAGGDRGLRWAGRHPGRLKNNGLRTNSGAGIGPMVQPNRLPLPGLKPKDLVGIPWRVAFALQEQGWWLRQDLIWAKRNPMPESVRDRCTKAHDYVFLLTKARRYWYNAQAIMEPRAESDAPGTRRNKRSVWTFATQPTHEAHFAAYPIELPETCLRAGCPEDGIVLDPFAGIGTTGLACLRNGRGFMGIELKQDYVDIAYGRARKYVSDLAEAAS
ncbi:MAG: site-specific DNA-methyltransferase [Bryobacteraceae bacterium]